MLLLSLLFEGGWIIGKRQSLVLASIVAVMSLTFTVTAQITGNPIAANGCEIDQTCVVLGWPGYGRAGVLRCENGGGNRCVLDRTAVRDLQRPHVAVAMNENALITYPDVIFWVETPHCRKFFPARE